MFQESFAAVADVFSKSKSAQATASASAGAGVGGLVAISLGEMGLAVGGTAIAVTAAPLIIGGGLLGGALYVAYWLGTRNKKV